MFCDLFFLFSVKTEKTNNLPEHRIIQNLVQRFIRSFGRDK